MQSVLSSAYETDRGFVKNALPQRSITANKGDFGKLLLICGSYGMAGACILCARAALRSGIGLLYILLDKRIYTLVSAAVPEAVCFPVDMENKSELRQKIDNAMEICNACVIGCGLGTLRDTVCAYVFSSCTIPLLIDADAINYLSEHPSVLPKASIITPHLGELSRLNKINISVLQKNRLETAKITAKRLSAVVLLKGAGTIIASPDGRVNINTTGNPGMAKAGSGDMLSGIIGTYLAQGMGIHTAACVGAYIHGEAGDICARRLSMQAMLPTDMIEALPYVYRRYEREYKQ